MAEELVLVDLLGEFWDVLLWLFWAYVYIAYLFAIVFVLGDIFRDHSLNGWLKAVWILCLVFVPFLTVLVYVIARGTGMSERNSREFGGRRAASASGAGSVSPASAADEIAKARELLDTGTITPQEFESLKARALA